MPILQASETNKRKAARQILVVDDEPAVCETIKMVLEHDVHNVQTANSGREALSLLEQSQFDLVTTDYSMSGMKGGSLAATIKQHLPNQPVLMISTNGILARDSGDPLPGVDMVIGKPFLLDDLRKAVARLLPEA